MLCAASTAAFLLNIVLYFLYALGLICCERVCAPPSLSRYLLQVSPPSPITYLLLLSRYLLQVTPAHTPLTAMVVQQDLLINYDLCLWKFDGLLNRPSNTYLIWDARERMQAGNKYIFGWQRDSGNCEESK